MWSELRTSLRFRLAMVFVLGSLGTLVAVSGFLCWAFQREINLRNADLLAGSIQELALVRRQHPRDLAALRDELATEGTATADPKTYLRILEGNRVLVETPGMASLLPAFRFPGTAKARQGHRRFLLAQQNSDGQVIQGALDITADERLIHAYRRRLGLALLAGAAVCAGFGWWATHRGLAPLRALAESTRSITAERLRDRLDPGQVPQELKDLVRALNDMLDRLDYAFSRLSQFSADLAHELRTPITNLMGEAEVALAHGRPVEEYRQVLESSLEEYHRLSQLISRMLFLARNEDPKAAIAQVRLDTAGLLDDVLGYFEACAEEQGVALRREGAAFLRGDADLLRQALGNLVANALGATPQGGEILVSARPAGAWTLLSVRDSGLGIPAEELPHLLDRFYRTREARRRKSGGTGLGLAIVHSIVTLHGGELDIASQPGVGTTVTLRLPA